MDKCLNCKFYFKSNQNLEQGLCRNVPPQLFIVRSPAGDVFVSHFPGMQDEGWCGKYEKKLEL